VAVAYDAITYGDEEGPTAHIHLDDEDRQAVEARLADLPSASNEEFFSFSTRLEVLEIAVEAIKSRMMSTGLGRDPVHEYRLRGDLSRRSRSSAYEVRLSDRRRAVSRATGRVPH